MHIDAIKSGDWLNWVRIGRNTAVESSFHWNEPLTQKYSSIQCSSSLINNNKQLQWPKEIAQGVNCNLDSIVFNRLKRLCAWNSWSPSTKDFLFHLKREKKQYLWWSINSLKTFRKKRLARRQRMLEREKKEKRNTEWEEIRWKSHYLSFISSIPNELNEKKKKKKLYSQTPSCVKYVEFYFRKLFSMANGVHVSIVKKRERDRKAHIHKCANKKRHPTK